LRAIVILKRLSYPSVAHESHYSAVSYQLLLIACVVGVA
jgi:hypothetical protein